MPVIKRHCPWSRCQTIRLREGITGTKALVGVKVDGVEGGDGIQTAEWSQINLLPRAAMNMIPGFFEGP